MKKVKALVVEDEEDWQIILCRALQQCHCDVDIANSYDLVEKLLSRGYDMVILDLVLNPVEDRAPISISSGWRLLDVFNDYPNLSIYVVTGSRIDSKHSFDLGNKHHVKGFMSKGNDFQWEELREWVEEIRKQKTTQIAKAAAGSIYTLPMKANFQIDNNSEVIKILYLAANPKDSVQLRLSEEIRSINQAMQNTEFRNKFHITQEWAVRISDLQNVLLRHRPHIVHFSGHGSEANEIILEDYQGNCQPVSGQALKKLFALLKDNIHCVILNACDSEYQAAAIACHIDYVIGMSKRIEDQAAISFSKSFYQALGFGRDIKTAFELGRLELELENMQGQDIPQLLNLKTASEKIVFVNS